MLLAKWKKPVVKFYDNCRWREDHVCFQAFFVDSFLTSQLWSEGTWYLFDLINLILKTLKLESCRFFSLLIVNDDFQFRYYWFHQHFNKFSIINLEFVLRFKSATLWWIVSIFTLQQNTKCKKKWKIDTRSFWREVR